MWRAENRAPVEKPLGEILNPYKTSSPGIEPRLHRGKANRLTTAPTPTRAPRLKFKIR